MKILLTTTMGEIELTLDAASAPATVDNFARYARDGHYDGTVFHRVIDGFMIQGGGFEPGMRLKSTRDAIANEADNGLLNAVGTVAMARTSDPHSATAQFFINTQDNDFLNHKSRTPEGWGYCVFGCVSAGMDVVTAIEECATTVRAGHRDVPEQDVLIERARVLEDQDS